MTELTKRASKKFLRSLPLYTITQLLSSVNLFCCAATTTDVVYSFVKQKYRDGGYASNIRLVFEGTALDKIFAIADLMKLNGM